MSYTLDPGFKLTVANKITSAQSGPGSTLDTQDLKATGKNPIFTVQPSGMSTSRTISFAARCTTAVATTATGSLYESSDGGTTWNLHGSTLALIATSTATDQQVTLVAGLLYQLLLTAITLGSATDVSVDAFVS